MGIEAYKDKVDKSSGPRNVPPSNSSENSKETEEDNIDKEDFFKIVGAEGGKKKVFKTEEQWKQTVEFIENEFMMGIDRVMDMDPVKRHDILHRAILRKDKDESASFYPIRECFICDETFVFPNNWNFVNYKGESVCCDHTISEVSDKYESINGGER